MNAFTRMFYEPNSQPPRLSMARLISWPCSCIGFALLVRGAFVQWNEGAIYFGMGLIAFAVVLYTLVEWRRIKIAGAEIDRDSDEKP